MIETEQGAIVDAGIDDVWAYVHDIGRWAQIMPGYRDCAIADANDSLWTLKVGVGGLVRTVRVAVHVEEWAGPESVRFTYQLAGDPVRGGGSYRATPIAAGRTQISLIVRVVGSGPMAPMWEAMGKPLLPQFTRDFADQLKQAIEASLARPQLLPAAPPARDSWAWLRRLWQRLFGQQAN